MPPKVNRVKALAASGSITQAEAARRLAQSRRDKSVSKPGPKAGPSQKGRQLMREVKLGSFTWSPAGQQNKRGTVCVAGDVNKDVHIDGCSYRLESVWATVEVALAATPVQWVATSGFTRSETVGISAMRENAGTKRTTGVGPKTVRVPYTFRGGDSRDGADSKLYAQIYMELAGGQDPKFSDSDEYDPASYLPITTTIWGKYSYSQAKRTL